jgi:ATP-dependent Lon protease
MTAAKIAVNMATSPSLNFWITDKQVIARRFLIPEALVDARRGGSIAFSDGALRYLVHLCRADAGTRGLKS